MGNTVIVDGEFELLSHRSSIQQEVRPIGAAKVHLMQRARRSSHQPPFQTLGRNVERQMGR